MQLELQRRSPRCREAMWLWGDATHQGATRGRWARLEAARAPKRGHFPRNAPRLRLPHKPSAALPIRLSSVSRYLFYEAIYMRTECKRPSCQNPRMREPSA